MKKTSFICIAVLCIFASCKKSNSSSGYHVTATIDGTTQSFNVSPVAVALNDSGYQQITIVGLSSTSSIAGSLGVTWSNNVTTQGFGVATYTDTATSYAITGDYIPNMTSSYVSGSGMVMTAANSNVSIANHLKLVITAVDSTHIKGTFSGDFYFSGDITGAIKTVTNGDFDVPWKK